MKILGAIGRIGSGKDEVVKYLRISEYVSRTSRIPHRRSRAALREPPFENLRIFDRAFG